MRKFFLIILLLAAMPSLCPAQSNPDELVVATFNVRFLDKYRPDYDYKFGGQPWPVRRPAVKALFEQNPIDIAGLQEVRASQYDDLVEDLGKDWFIYCPGRLSGGKMVRSSDESTGFMYRKSRFNMLGHGCFWLSETPQDTASTRLGQRSPIIVSWLQLEEKARPGKPLWFFSAHISWSVKDNPALPDQEVETLLTEMERLTGMRRDAFRVAPIFLVGDLNNTGDESAIQTLGRWFGDARLTSPESPSTAKNTFNSYGNAKHAAIIDYIFYGGGTPKEYLVDDSNRYAPEVKYISDHYPVLFRMSLPGAEKGIPSPVFDARPEYVGLYWTAWKQAKEHIKYQPGLVQPRYMDEGFRDEVIWIWDSEFMVMFCKYAPRIFPGIETLDNFYYTLHENAGSPLSVWHPDNPPFFAWVENDYYKFTADKAHIRNLIRKKRFLQKHFTLFNTMNHDTEFPFPISNDGIRIQYKGIGYNWQSWQSGMDNTPRKREMPLFWVDAISQQALSALYIARLAKVVGDKATKKEFKAKYEDLKEKVNKYYWDETDGCYYDIKEEGLSKTHILTPASFWPMLAEIPSREQAERVIRFALQDGKLGGPIPWTSVARDDEQFDPDGNYWKGSVWLPTAYMGIKALEKYGYFEEADKTAQDILEHMWQTYSQYEPHTIWECYSPTRPEPSSKKEGTKNVKTVKADFCGWSALGPISLFIENVLGFYEVDATAAVVRWNLHQSCRHGIEDLSFGKITTSILYENGKVSVVSNKPYTLYINGTPYHIRRGANTLEPKI